MPFKRILSAMVDSDPAVQCAIVADWQGEAVDWFSSEMGVEDLQIFGAHLGIILNRMRTAALAGCHGETAEVLIRAADADWFVFPVTSEYYLAVAARRLSQRAGLCRRMGQCVDALREEIV